jgi:hypothetical protein
MLFRFINPSKGMEMTTNIIPKYGLQKITPVIIHPMIIVQAQNKIPMFPPKKKKP